MTQLPALGRFPGLAAERMAPEQTALARTFLERSGSIPGPYKIWLSSAPAAARLKALSDQLLRQGLLSRREAEIAILVTAHATKASFVEAAHRRIGAEVGLSSDAVDAICAGADPDLPDERERVVYEASRAMHADRPSTPELFDRAVRLLGHDGLTELSMLLGFYCSCAFTLSFYAVEPSSPSTA